MSSGTQINNSCDTKNGDEPNQAETRNYSTSIDNPFPKINFLRQRKGSNDVGSITNTQNSARLSILNSSTCSPKLKNIDYKLNSDSQSFFQNQLEKSQFISLEPFLNKLPLISQNYQKVDPYLSTFLLDLDKVLQTIYLDFKRLEKSTNHLQQQLQIQTHALRTREDIIQKMREENIKINRKVQQTMTELEATKLRHERFTKQNNDNFYKISQQIKESLNIKQNKQQNQIEHLKNIINSPTHLLSFGQRNYSINQKSLLSPHSNSSFAFPKEKSLGNFNLKLSQLETVVEAEPTKYNGDERLDSNNLQSNPLLNFVSNENLSLQEKQSSQENRIVSTYFDLPDESKFEEVRKFFIQSDLTDLKCNKGQRELNMAKKVQMQKAKLHSMFLLSTPTNLKLKKQTQIIQPSQQLPIKQKTKTMLPSPKLFQNNQQLKSAQKQFNQNLTINYHHTKASSLVHEFFEFKDDKNDNPKVLSSQQIITQRLNTNQTTDSPTKVIRNDFLQHTADFHFYSLLLDMSKSEKSIQKVHNDNIFLKFLQKVASQETEFRNFMMNLTPEKYSNFFESIQHVLQNEIASLNMILKLKRIILSVQKMHSSLMLTDAFNTIIFETCQVLNCDRASVFLIDPRRNELWTKVAKNSKPIRVQIGKGLVGIVAQTGEILNILDAHQDSRFNRDVDKNNNYRTKSVLCLPIKDQNQNHIIGVLQAINKNDGDFFTKEDEGLLLILSQLATAVLRNSLYHDEREVYHNSLKSLVNAGIVLSSEKSLKSVLVRSQSILLNTFDIPQANIWILDDNTNQLVRYYLEEDQMIEIQEKDINQDFILEQRCSVDQGIVGKIFQTCKSENILNAYQHSLYNGAIDINTSLPVITIVIKSQLDSIDSSIYKKIGVLQCINPKGLESLVFNQNGKNGSDVPHAYYEILDYFGQIIGDNTKRFMKLD